MSADILCYDEWGSIVKQIRAARETDEAPDYTARDWLSGPAQVNEDLRRRRDRMQGGDGPCDTEGE